MLAPLLVALALGQTSVNVNASDTVQSGCVMSALDAGCVIPMRGKTSAGVIVTAVSSPVGITLSADTSRDGTSWDNHPFYDADQGDQIASVANGDLAVGFTKSINLGSGVRFVRVRSSAWTSGSATISLIASDTTPSITPLAVANSSKPTYVLCSGALANTAASESMACEAGAAKAFRVRAIYVTQPGSQTTAAVRTLTLKRTTTAGSAGTTVTPAKLDSNDAAFSGVCRTKGTAGTAGVTLLTAPVWTPTTVANLALPIPLWPPISIGTTTVKDLVVPAGTANGVAVADSGAAGGANHNLCFLLTEE